MSERDGRRRDRPGGGPAPRAAALVALAAAVLSVGGCGTLLGSFGTAPDGLPHYEHDLRTLLRQGRADSALARVDPERAEVGDELLRLQYEVLLAHHAGRWEQSNAALEEAVRIAEDRYTRSVSRAILSVVTSDRVIPYDPPAAERLLLHYYGALNYLRLEQPGGAAVEARRLGRELMQGEEGELPAGRRDLHVFLHRFTAAVFEAAGEADAARVSRRRAARLEGAEDGPAGAPPDIAAPPEDRPVPGAPDGPPEVSVASADSAAVGSGAPVSGDPAGGATPRTGEVVLLVERGFVAHRVERSLNVLLWPDEMRRLRPARLAAAAEGSGTGGPSGSAVPDSAEQLETALQVARRALSGGGGGRRSDDGGFPWPWAGQRVCGPGAVCGSPAGGPRAEAATAAPSSGRASRRVRDPYLLRVAWPAFRRDELAGRVAVETVDGARAAPSGRASVSDAAVEEFRRDEAQMLAKTILRGVAKAAIAGKLEEELSEEDETVGEIAGLAANALGALLERADTRCWHLLPDRLSLVRLRLPAGTHTLRVGTTATGVRASASDPGPGSDVDVRVRPGGVTVASVRLWR